jgi:rhodanese-related sulfurtransferase
MRKMIRCVKGLTLLMTILAAVIFTVATNFGQERGFKEVTPREASKILSQSGDALLIDVRSRSEYEFVGHPPMAFNLPLMFWNPGSYSFKSNPNFKKELGERVSRDKTLLFMCRSGGRSEKAAQIAVSLGFKKVFNIIEGFEGEKDSEGHRTVNGWKNAGLPYTFKVNDKLKYQGPE